MMQLSKALGSFVFVGVIAASVTASAGDESLVNVACSGGAVTVTAAAPWHTNDKAPWKWDKGSKVSLDEHAAKFKGDKCEGSIKAYVCNGDQCKGPIVVTVK